VAEANNWEEVIQPPEMLDACTVDGRVYCAPVNIHSDQWLWLNNQVYEDLGLPVPTNWNEFVVTADEVAAAGKQPLALGGQPWQSSLAFNVMAIGIAGQDVWLQVYRDKDEAAAAGPELAKGSNVQDWNQATNMVVTGEAAAQIMGDWAQGEFALAGMVAGEDYTCLPGLGINGVLGTAGDAFYFPAQDDPEVTAAQKELAALLISPEVQVSFNLAKGSLPIRGDVDLSAANDCMKKGLEILAAGDVIPSTVQLNTEDTNTQINDLMTEFWSSDMSAADAQARFAEIIASAE
jgi:glucose/mannose transport system substrate-binding protein